ncbi:hypothetical protein [Novosphingobium sp. CECT 9465]|uniref:hypothetical protein n=1 Tax=Novosphingobium sp. CECT 9465 TaxID=2829794 RepID=UPI001E4D0159|nr:hypothetical protein [Novosphingobium sp. CECT 9465]
MMLILYYAEELKRDVINGVAAQMRWRGHNAAQPSGGEGPSQEGKKQKHAFGQLVQDGVLTDDERKHMVGLIGRRNSIAHHLDHVTADLTTDRTVREWLDYYPDRQAHDYKALDQLRAARTLLSERMAAHHYVLEIDLRGMFFESTERVLNADLKALERRIMPLMQQRRDNIAQLNAEMSLEGSDLTGLFDPRWPENRYGNRQRLTPRGVETCYLLFDMGKSPLAVAHLMDLSLATARRRARLWKAAGGSKRERPSHPDFRNACRRDRSDD